MLKKQLTIGFILVVVAHTRSDSIEKTTTPHTQTTIPTPQTKKINNETKKLTNFQFGISSSSNIPFLKSIKINERTTTPLPNKQTVLPTVLTSKETKEFYTTTDFTIDRLEDSDNFTPSLIFEPEPESDETLESTKMDEVTKFYESYTNDPNKYEKPQIEGIGIKLFRDEPTQPPRLTEPKISEITTKIEDGDDDVKFTYKIVNNTKIKFGPRIDEIEAKFEAKPPSLQHMIPSRLEEKLEALSCDVPQLPSGSRLWNGNETHEMNFPITIPSECEPDDIDCTVGSYLSWEGSIEIQAADILLVRIDDTKLLADKNISRHFQHKQPETAVYQVNKAGQTHCDTQEGTLLDITPLVVDGKKLITLYDKDLTEGINLLIVVSELWEKQCVQLKISVKIDNCGENADCFNKGICFSNNSMDEYECQCCPGYVGQHCGERDACYFSPCQNNGICVDLSQGHEGNTFQCLCPYGYTGKTCEEETDPCESSPCQNGATCTGNRTQFRCECSNGYTGDRCQHVRVTCQDSSCGNNGVCIKQNDEYKCYCKQGYTGENCEYQYNECESSPCLNGGTCMDKVSGFSCICGRGYNGKRCHIKVDLCDPEPCPQGRICVDKGNIYSCECPKGMTGPNCNQPMKAVCSSSPCKNGGTCWSSVDSFYCACAPSYTGITCSQQITDDLPDHDVIVEDVSKQFHNMNAPLSVKLDKLHNIYVTIATLTCTLLIVVTIVAACHCKVHETYKRCFLKATPLLPCKIRRLDILPKHSRTGKPLLEFDKQQQSASQSRSYPGLDTTEVYYTLDFSDSQNSPLIQ